MHEQLIYVPADHLRPNPDNPRKQAGDVTELAASIRSGGMLQPIRAVSDPEKGPGFYIIEAGYRRWVAGRHVLEELPVIVRATHPDEDLRVQGLITGLVENIHRENLTPMEKARAYGRLRDEAHLTQGQIAGQVGVAASSVSRSMMLLDLAPAAQARIESGKLKVEDALNAVKDHRARNRDKQGHKQIDVGWEPDHFTKNHHLAKKAKTMCDAREHTGRRRYDGMACGQCFETAIRQDQAAIDRAEFKEAGFDIPFNPPVMTPGTRTNGATHR